MDLASQGIDAEIELRVRETLPCARAGVDSGSAPRVDSSVHPSAANPVRREIMPASAGWC